MKHILLAALMLGAAALAGGRRCAQQASITQTIAGTRLDISATGEVTRVPDVAIISAGVVTRSATATAALQQDSANRMDRVLAALKRAGVADRDIQTSNVNLNPEYRYPEQPAAAAGRLHRHQHGNDPLPRHSQLGQDPRRAGRAKAPTRSTART